MTPRPVAVVEYDPSWPRAFAALAARAAAALAREPVVPARIEHVGSTAVPGLAAKPVLDLQAEVGDLGCAPEVAAVLAPLGWHHVPPDLDARPWRRFLVHVVDGRRAAHLHLMTTGTARLAEQRGFRDALRADPGLRAVYAERKRALAAAHADDREAYTEGKAEVVRRVLRSRPPG